ncbi:N-alpha-acetyltransferase 20 [Echinococcus granulosus]|nr:N-alpha-acetyltransferase 20 [Echinococcus granulosus]
MTTYREFNIFDLLRFANVNLDPFTETYSSSYYMQYMSMWPEYMRVAESPILTVFASKADSVLGGRVMGYMIAKSEGYGENWHGHVTALSVAPEYRRMGLASRLMLEFEDTSDRQVQLFHEFNCVWPVGFVEKKCYFADLFVRASNELGHSVYTKLGYIIYRRVLNYYAGKDDGEDAFDMRKALSADKDRRSVKPMTRPVHVDELEFT